MWYSSISLRICEGFAPKRSAMCAVDKPETSCSFRNVSLLTRSLRVGPRAMVVSLIEEGRPTRLPLSINQVPPSASATAHNGF